MQCVLCEINVNDHPIVSESEVFCCPGCHAVYQILKTQGEKEAFRTHPLFEQAIRSGLISNPTLLEQLQQKTISDLKYEKLHLEIEQMWCPSCAEVIRWILLKESGIRNCFVDYTTDLASIEFAPQKISKEQIFTLISKLGYHPSTLESSEKKELNFSLLLRFSIAAFCSLNIMMFAYPIYASYFSEDDGSASMFAWLSLASSLPILTYCSWPIVKRCITALSLGIVGMELLVVVGVAASFALSLYNLLQGSLHIYLDSMSVIIAFVLLGKMVETKAKFTAKDSLFRISRNLPRRGRKKFPDGTSQFVPLKDIHKKEQILILSGEKIPLDGRILEGKAFVEEAAMTGEAFPLEKSLGDLLLAGSTIVQGWVCIEVTATLKETALHKIVEMIEQDLHRKTPYIRKADQIVAWFVPAVFLIAIATFSLCWIHDASLETAAMRAVSVLLIACPCAIGIAAPLAESKLIYELACLGAIVRNRGCLRLLGKETALVFDKTGTITQGKFQIRDHRIDSHSTLLKGLASYSNHPISVAVAKSLGVSAQTLDFIQEHAGLGMEGKFQNKTYRFGSSKFMHLYGIEIPMTDASPLSYVYFAEENRLIETISLQDILRKGAIEMVHSCRPAKTYLVSGDAFQAVESVAKACQFDVFYWAQSPLQKREMIETIQKEGHVVTMVGDGINDAPALAISDVSISMVDATEISIQVSDILLTTNDLQVITQIRKLARKGQKISNQNLFWAFAYNVLGVGLAVFGYLTPIFSAVAMVTSSLMVILNTKRIFCSKT